MFRFISSLPAAELNDKYLEIFSDMILYNIQLKYSSAREISPPEMREWLQTFTAKELMVKDFSSLVDIYYKYTGITATLPKEEKDRVNDGFAAAFSYSNYADRIRRFLDDEANGFAVKNCVYCDLEDVRGFEEGNGVKRLKFEADHILDKGECPLTGLSIHNFVSSCHTCNSRQVKGTKPIGLTKDEVLKLSPKMEENRFAEEVRFILNLDLKGGRLKDLNLFRSNDGWDIDFLKEDEIYERTIGIFKLRHRYNAEKIKDYMREFLDKRMKNPDSEIRRMSDCLGKPEEEIREELFSFERYEKERRPAEKCRRDLLSDFDSR